MTLVEIMKLTNRLVAATGSERSHFSFVKSACPPGISIIVDAGTGFAPDYVEVLISEAQAENASFDLLEAVLTEITVKVERLCAKNLKLSTGEKPMYKSETASDLKKPVIGS